MHSVRPGDASTLPVVQKRLGELASKIQKEQDKRNEIIALNLFQNLEASNYNLTTKYRIPRDFFTRQIDEIREGSWQEATIAVIVVALSIISLVGIFFVVNGALKSKRYKQLEKDLSDIQSREKKLIDRQTVLKRKEATTLALMAVTAQPVRLRPDTPATSPPTLEVSSEDTDTPREFFGHLKAFVQKNMVMTIDVPSAEGKTFWDVDKIPMILNWLKRAFLTRKDRKDISTANFLIAESKAKKAEWMVLGIKGIQKSTLSDSSEKQFLFILAPFKVRNEWVYSLEIYDVTKVDQDTNVTTLKPIKDAITEEDEILNVLNELMDKGMVIQGHLVEKMTKPPATSPA